MSPPAATKHPIATAVLRRPPVVRLSRVCHIGTLDPAEKSRFSWEAHGLSVSLHPEEWEAIAKLGGRPWQLLERDNGAFLAYWALGPRPRRRIAYWGVTHGLVTRTYVHACGWWDDELEDTMMTFHPTRSDALEEAEDHDASSISRVVTYPATSRLAQRTGTAMPEFDAFDALLLCYVEDEHPELDGVWWEDARSPLSAPRGALVPARLARWSSHPLDRTDAERLLLRLTPPPARLARRPHDTKETDARSQHLPAPVDRAHPRAADQRSRRP